MRVNITLSDGTYIYSDNPTKRKIASLNSRLRDKVGTCRVDYGHRMYNEFKFAGSEDFMFKLEPCIEKELVKELS